MFDVKTPLRHWSTWFWTAALCVLGFAVLTPGWMIQILPGLMPILPPQWQQVAAMLLGVAGLLAKFVQQDGVKVKLESLRAWLRRMGTSGGVAPRAAVAGGIMTAAVALALPLIVAWEGKANNPYSDLGQVETVCFGHTGAVESRHYSDEECHVLLDSDILHHARPVLTCSPRLAGHVEMLAAFTSFDFNTGAYCRSSIPGYVAAGNYRAACAQLSRWVYVGGRRVQGLVNRRAAERRLCERGL